MREKVIDLDKKETFFFHHGPGGTTSLGETTLRDACTMAQKKQIKDKKLMLTMKGFGEVNIGKTLNLLIMFNMKWIVKNTLII